MFTIFGSGFGLYGYLPALLHILKRKVVLPVQYKSILEERVELRPLSEKVSWVETHDEALLMAEHVIFAVPPNFQETLIERCLEYSNIKNFFLEKPMAVDPLRACLLEEKIEKFQKGIYVGYSLLFTPWAENINFQTAANNSVTITWKFMAHHYRAEKFEWKHLHRLGGGALRFYGIHLVALLAKQNYDKVVKSQLIWRNKDEPYKWSATFTGNGLPPVFVEVDTMAETKEFNIFIDKKGPIVSLIEPFAELPPIDNFDLRISVMAKLLSEGFLTQPDERKNEVKNILRLWTEVEAKEEMNLRGAYE